MTRFSQLYVERGKPASDSPTLRRRLAAFIENRLEPDSGVERLITSTIQEELGHEVPFTPYGPLVPKFFIEEATPVLAILDAITIIARVFDLRQTVTGRQWKEFVARALREENVAYRLGDDGIMHPFIDAEFEANRVATLASLDQARFGEARHDFDAAMRHLRNGENKQAIRAMFPAVETAAKVLYPGQFAGFDVNEIKRHLAPQVERKYAGNAPARVAARGLLRSFEYWVVASQAYRHGQEVQDPTEAPQDLAVAHISAGGTFLRWMIELSA